METLTILPGFDKNGEKETFDEIRLQKGNVYSIVGPTGSGKSRLIKDIELLVNSDSITKRKILLDDRILMKEERFDLSTTLIAHLGQGMKFILDLSVEEFLKLHRDATATKPVDLNRLIAMANRLCDERIELCFSLSMLSGGQSRALMIADIAFISNRPIVLIDEIENAGINKDEALKLLLDKDKIVLLVTHDVHTALLTERRIVLSNGGIRAFIQKTDRERQLFITLDEIYRKNKLLLESLRKGEELVL